MIYRQLPCPRWNEGHHTLATPGAREPGTPRAQSPGVSDPARPTFRAAAPLFRGDLAPRAALMGDEWRVLFVLAILPPKQSSRRRVFKEARCCDASGESVDCRMCGERSPKAGTIVYVEPRSAEGKRRGLEGGVGGIFLGADAAYVELYDGQTDHFFSDKLVGHPARAAVYEQAKALRESVVPTWRPAVAIGEPTVGQVRDLAGRVSWKRQAMPLDASQYAADEDGCTPRGGGRRVRRRPRGQRGLEQRQAGERATRGWSLEGRLAPESGAGSPVARLPGRRWERPSCPGVRRRRAARALRGLEDARSAVEEVRAPTMIRTLAQYDDAFYAAA